jgi:trans-2-enoyl-CoA reductase
MLFAPINPADLNMIAGSYPIQPSLPAVGGNEGLGRVISVGDRVSSLKVGDLVIPATASLGITLSFLPTHNVGTWRSHLNTEENNLIAVSAPAGVTEENLACLAVNPASAFRMLEDFVELKEGR